MPDQEFKICAVVTAFNSEPYILEAIESVVGQTCRPAEIVVADNGSTDDTVELVKREHPDLKVVQQSNLGPGGARNGGIFMSQSPWLAFLEAKDRWLPDKLERQAATLAEAEDEILACHGGARIIDGGGPSVKRPDDYGRVGGAIFHHGVEDSVIPVSAFLAHRSVFGMVGDFDESFPVCDTYDFWLRLTSIMPVACVDGVVCEEREIERTALLEPWEDEGLRVRALCKLISVGKLSGDDQQLALTVLREKTSRFCEEAAKHGRTTLSENTRDLAAQFVDL